MFFNFGNFSNCSELLKYLFQYISTSTGSCPNS